jgi:hypothetical protein
VTCDHCGTTEAVTRDVAERPNDVGMYESRDLCAACDRFARASGFAAQMTMLDALAYALERIRNGRRDDAA